MKNFIKKLTGQDKVEAKLAEDVAQVEAEKMEVEVQTETVPEPVKDFSDIEFEDI